MIESTTFKLCLVVATNVLVGKRQCSKHSICSIITSDFIHTWAELVTQINKRGMNTCEMARAATTSEKQSSKVQYKTLYDNYLPSDV